MKRLPGSTFFASLLLTLAAPSLLLAQESTTPNTDFGITFRVTSISWSPDTNRELQREAQMELEGALLDRGAALDEHPGWTFAVAAKNVASHDDLVALSVVALGGLPESVVQWGKESQVFYVDRAAIDDLPAEGRFVREYVSEDYIRQFGMLQDHEVVVVERSRLREGAARIVDLFYARHTRP